MVKDKIVSIPMLLKKLPGLKRKFPRIVFTNGCFDILHKGHVAYLEKAKLKGDLLVIGVNSDRSVKMLKGDERPINRLLDRMYVLAGLVSVDFVVSFDEETPEQLIRLVQPNILIKGGDWKKEDIVGADFVHSYGGQVYTINYVKGYSTTSLIADMKKNEKKLIHHY